LSSIDPAKVQPSVSVIVPTYNRAAVLPYLFEALGRQLYPSASMELIVVDNSSKDDTEAVVERWRTALPFEVRFYRKENRGPAASRNYGAARARADILAFTDSDCIPDPCWLRNAAAAFSSRDVGIVCGPFVLRPREDSGLFDHQVLGVVSDTGLYPTANLVVRAEAFGAVHGFDEQFGLYPWGDLVAGEDTDFAWRVKRTGRRAVFSSGVVVGHQFPQPSFRSLLLKPVVLQIFPRLLRTIPELRQTALWKRYFLSPMHLYYYLAILGVAAAGATRSLLPLLALAPWFVASGRVAAQAGQWRRAVAWFLAIQYSVSLAALVLIAGSLRYRRLVL